MKTSIAWSSRTRSASARIVKAFGLTMVIGGLWATPAFGEDNHDHPSQQRRGQNHDYQHRPGQQEPGGNWHGNQRYDRRGGNGYGNQRYRYDDQRSGYVYAPPPVTYVPQPSPGVTLVFPLQFR
ncbi:hypothetical protein [Cupriavidus sp. D39]|uniref:hypothetical protein n=1 Tax=Cupriavidus sp. D39 TaxID=2997877 RepID=UPI00226E1656|nr:hypothetical protein [Cupriavidus sp. D39]MCY0853967.1 hypothetical protein [Cupriavidus sp. D39]